MKTVYDFKLIDGVAVLNGVAYAEEAKIVEEYLKEHRDIAFVSVIAQDGRYYELKNSKLILSNEKTFRNPFYTEESKDNIEYSKSTNINQLGRSKESYHWEGLEERIAILEKQVATYQSLLADIIKLISSFN